MRFIHKDIDYTFEEIGTKQVDGVRYYDTPRGLYPSVTTVLNVIPKPELEAWRESVGEEFATEYTRKAAARGEAVHQLAEDYLSNRDIHLEKYTDDEKRLFNSLKLRLNKIGKIVCLEKPLYSETLKMAGRVDCIVEHDGEIQVVDFKTASRTKSDNIVHQHFIQATAYALMFEEMTGIQVKSVAIYCAVMGEAVPAIYQSPVTTEFVRDLLKIRKLFDKQTDK